MVAKIISALWGDMPEPMIVVPFETWEAFELTGKDDEFIITDIVKAFEGWSYEKSFPIEKKDIRCKTITYEGSLKDVKGGILVPKDIIQQFGIKKDRHVLKVTLKKVIKGDVETKIHPERDTFDFYPQTLKENFEKEE